MCVCVVLVLCACGAAVLLLVVGVARICGAVEKCVICFVFCFLSTLRAHFVAQVGWHDKQEKREQAETTLCTLGE